MLKEANTMNLKGLFPHKLEPSRLMTPVPILTSGEVDSSGNGYFSLQCAGVLFEIDDFRIVALSQAGDWWGATSGGYIYSCRWQGGRAHLQCYHPDQLSKIAAIDLDAAALDYLKKLSPSPLANIRGLREIHRGESRHVDADATPFGRDWVEGYPICPGRFVALRHPRSYIDMMTIAIWQDRIEQQVVGLPLLALLQALNGDLRRPFYADRVLGARWEGDQVTLYHCVALEHNHHDGCDSGCAITVDDVEERKVTVSRAELIWLINEQLQEGEA